MAPDYQDEFVIDFTSTAREEYWVLYITMMKSLIYKESSLLVLQSAESASRPALLPSWVPNWNSTPRTESFVANFHAGWRDENFKAPCNLFLPGSNSIRLRGVQIEVIKAVSNLCSTYQTKHDDEGKREYNLERLRAITQALELYRQLPDF